MGEVEGCTSDADCAGIGQCVSVDSRLVDPCGVGGICICADPEKMGESRVHE